MAKEIVYPSETYQERFRSIYENTPIQMIGGRFLAVLKDGLHLCYRRTFLYRHEAIEALIRASIDLFEKGIKDTGISLSDVYPSPMKDYFVTTSGDVFNKGGHLLKGANNSKGYLFLRTGENGDGKRTTCLLHRLIAETFLPNPEGFPVVNHIDGNKKNNSVSNLEWCSYSRNNQHAVDTGLRKPTPKKLDESIVRDIRENCIKGDRERGCRAFARKYGIDKSTVIRIVNGEAWERIDD